MARLRVEGGDAVSLSPGQVRRNSGGPVRRRREPRTGPGEPSSWAPGGRVVNPLWHVPSAGWWSEFGVSQLLVRRYTRGSRPGTNLKGNWSNDTRAFEAPAVRSCNMQHVQTVQLAVHYTNIVIVCACVRSVPARLRQTRSRTGSDPGSLRAGQPPGRPARKNAVVHFKNLKVLELRNETDSGDSVTMRFT